MYCWWPRRLQNLSKRLNSKINDDAKTEDIIIHRETYNKKEEFNLGTSDCKSKSYYRYR